VLLVAILPLSLLVGFTEVINALVGLGGDAVTYFAQGRSERSCSSRRSFSSARTETGARWRHQP
jgi:hypothetical protein